MPRRPTHRDHGRSEIWSRPALEATIKRASKRLGSRLRSIRERCGFTQEVAAERAGIHAKHLGVIESGKKANVTFATLVALAAAYDVPLSRFFTTR